MKFFADGDLTVGIQVASHPYPLETLEGEWHIVWGHVDGNERTTNYDEPNALNMMSLTISRLEPADKRRKPMPDDDNIQIEFNFLKWGLIYQGRYGDVGGNVTNFRLVKNTTPHAVEADDGAVLLPALVRDDQDIPFLSFATSAMDRSIPHLETLQNMEFVVKKTDTTGRHCLELTRNERLRLGYRWDSEGEFEDVGTSHDDVEAILAQPRRPGETNPAVSGKINRLVRELTHLNEKREDVRIQLGMLRQRMMDELNDTALSPRATPPQTKNRSARTGTGSGIKRTASGATKPGSSSALNAAKAAAAAPRRTAATSRRTGVTRRRRGGGIGSRGGRRRRRTTTGVNRRTSNKSNERPARSSLGNAPTNGIAPSADEDAAGGGGDGATISNSDSDSEPEDVESDFHVTAGGADGRVNGAASDDERLRGPNQKYRYCDLCDCQVTRRNWNIHAGSLKHKAAAAGEPGSTVKRGAGGTKRSSGMMGGDGEDVVSPSSKRRHFGGGLASDDGKLKRPSMSMLRKEMASMAEGILRD